MLAVYSKAHFSKQKVCKTFFTIYIDLKSVCVQFINSPIKEQNSFKKYLHFHCQSLNEPLHLRCGSYLHEQIDLSHTHIRVI